MTRLFHTGFELGGGEYWDVIAPTVVSTTVRNGTYACNLGNSQPNPTHSIPNTAEAYLRWAYHGEAVRTTSNFLMKLLDITTIQVQLWNANGTLQVRANDSSVLASSAANVLDNNVYHLIEVHAIIASAGTFDVKVDGTTVITASVDTGTGTTNDYFNRVAFGPGGSDGTARMDDYAINNTSGPPNNSWIGDGRVIALIPNAVGDASDTTELTGVGQTALSVLYQNIDELPANTSDYNYGTTAGHYTIWNLTDTTNVASVNATMLWVRAFMNDAGPANFKFVTKTNSTKYVSANVALTQSWAYYSELRETNPNTAAAWTAANLDALQVGFEVQ